MTQAEFQSKLETAKRNLPLRQLMTQYGDHPASGNWKSFQCPFCKKKGKSAGLSAGKHSGSEIFKCFSASCPSGTQADGAACDEIEYVAFKERVPVKEAWKPYFKMAGVWQEERLSPSVLPGARKRKLHAEVEPANDAPAAQGELDGGNQAAAAVETAATAGAANVDKIDGMDSGVDVSAEAAETAATPVTADDEKLIQEAITLVRHAGQASGSILRRELHLGFIRADHILAELEKRGVVGSANGKVARRVFPAPAQKNLAGGAGVDSKASPSPANPGTDTPSLQPGPTTQGAILHGTPNHPAVPMAAPPVTTPASIVGAKGAATSEGNIVTLPGVMSDEDFQAAQDQEAAAKAAKIIPIVEVKAAPPTSRLRRGQSAGDGDTADAGGDSGGGDAGDDGGDGDGKQGGPRENAALRAFYELIDLIPEHRAKLTADRGFTDLEIDRNGFRSSVRGNREKILSLVGKFTQGELIEAGLLHEKEWKEPQPNSQLCGYGRKGKNAAGEDVWDTTNPLLIPYWGAGGELLDLRAHKGSNASGRPRLYVARRRAGEPEVAQPAAAPTDTTDDAASDPEAPPEVPPGPVDPANQWVVICEAEFKAAAVQAGLGDLVQAVGLPGISMAREDSAGSYPMVQELKSFLRTAGTKKVVIAFDNEEKGDPKLASYKQDKRKRYDAQIWARYLAITLAKQGYDARVGWLPTEWRDEQGKADWDGALARARTVGLPRPAGGKGLIKTAGQIKVAFRQVLTEARGGNEFAQLGLFDGEAEAIIRRGIERKFFRPELPSGGDRELEIAKRLERFVRSPASEGPGGALARKVAAAYRDIFGCYYELKNMLHNQKQRERWEQNLTAARQLGEDTGQWDKAFAIEKVLEGIPKAVSDFTMTPLYSVRRGSKVHRKVLLRAAGIGGEECLATLDDASSSNPTRFREWCQQRGGFAWSAGQEPLDLLVRQNNKLLAGLRVNELSHFGWHAEPKLWVFGDGLITSSTKTEPARLIAPDDEQILWHEDIGYLIGETDWEGEGFKLGRPLCHPTQGLRFAVPKVKGKHAAGGPPALDELRRGDSEAESEFELVEGQPDDPAAIQSLFRQLAYYLRETLRGTEAYLAIGSVLAYAGAPEMFELEHAFPGFWISGETRGGKSTLTGWLLKLFGFSCDAGIKMGDSTLVGFRVGAQQYCNLPIWFEEFERALERPKQEFLKSLMDRTIAAKKEFGERSRKIMTNAIVTGENTAGKSSIEARFAQIVVSEERRKAGLTEEQQKAITNWIEENKRFFLPWAGTACSTGRSSSSRFIRAGSGGATRRTWGRRTRAAAKCMASATRVLWRWSSYWREPLCRE